MFHRRSHTRRVANRSARTCWRRIRFEYLEPRCLLTSQTFNILGAPVTLDSSQYDASSIVVTLRPGQSAASFDSGQVSFSDGRSLGESEVLMTGIYQVNLAPGVGVSEAIAALQADASVLAAEPNLVSRIAALPTDPSFRDQWGLNNPGLGGPLFGTIDADIDAPEAWNIHTGTGNFVIAVLDTGIDYTHPDLINNIWINPGEIPGNGIDDDGNGFIDDVRGWDFINDDNNPLDDNLHGTHVAGTIAAQGNNGYGTAGVLWRAKIMPLKILDQFGFGSTSAIVRAIDYSVRMGAKVSNNSWGGPGASAALQAAIARANAAGQIFVAAAGNDGTNNDGFVFVENLGIVSQHHYPSDYLFDNIVSVAAMNRFDARAGFSNFGATSVDLAAPGESVLSTFPSYTTLAMAASGFSPYFGTINGTSMATPHVAGAIALLWDKFPTLNYRQVIDLILNNVRPVAGLNGVVKTGGVLNIYDALRAAGGIPGGGLPPAPDQPPPPGPVVNPNVITASNLTDVKIPDRSGGRSDIKVDQHITITDINIWVDIRHSAVGQLRVDVYRPGYPVPLILANKVGGSKSNFSITTFDDEAATSITAGAAPFKGSFKPQNALTAFDGKDAFGSWRLVVSDTVKGKTGLIAGWGFTINGVAISGASVSQTFTFDSDAGAIQSLVDSQHGATTSAMSAPAATSRSAPSVTRTVAAAATLQYRAPSTAGLSADAVDRMFSSRRAHSAADSADATLDDELCGAIRLAADAA